MRTSRSEFLINIKENFIFYFYIFIEPDTYASIHKATSYDNDPLPPVTKREDSSTLFSHNDRRQSSYDIDAPLPWQSDNNSHQQSTTTHEVKRNSLNNHPSHPLNDDYLFSPISKPIQPKPRLSLQTKTDDHYQSDDIHIPNTTTEHEPTYSMNFNSTIRKPMNDLLNTEWLSDSQPTKTTIEKSSLPHVEEHHAEEVEEADHDEQRSPSPQIHNHNDSNTYGSDNFEENDDSES